MAAKLRKTQDEEHVLDRRRGIKLRVEAWVDSSGRVARFNLAYINPVAFAGDNGRVLGYDNAHGEVHRHYLGAISALGEMTYEQSSDAFTREFQRLWKDWSS